MPVSAVVGAQWGDEGKGRVVDYLAQKADMVIRFQGGDNAGHTVVNAYGKFQLHIVPSGIFNPETTCIIGAGTVVNVDTLLKELASIEAAGVDTSNLLVEERAHLIFPFHLQIDGLEEAARSGAGASIGTTKRGVGPAYADKAARHGVRVGDLKRPDYLRARLSRLVWHKNHLLAMFGQPPVDLESLLEIAAAWRVAIEDRIVNTLPLIRAAVRGDRAVLLEGQLGAMKDLDWGTYPFVTSSNPTVGAACTGAGLPPQSITDAIGVVKAYSTSVGAGPFPSELLDDTGERLREIGGEYGATTGRPRRCGWFDAVAVSHTAWLNGFTALAVTKLDILDHFETLKLCVGYRIDGQIVHDVPDTPDYARAEPIYETMPGWLGATTTKARTWAALPPQAQAYLRRIEELAEVPIRYISVGPERDELIVLPSDGVPR